MMKHKIVKKKSIHTFFCLAILLLYGCSSDDETSPIENEIGSEMESEMENEMESEIVPPAGTISFTINNSAINRETILNLANGDFIDEEEVPGPISIEEHQDHTYLFRGNSLVKQDGNGNLVWEKTYPENNIVPFEIFNSNVVFEGETVYFSYSRLDTVTFERTHFLECISLIDGGTLWIKNVNGETFPSLVNGRLLTLTYPNGNSPVNFAYLDKETGSTNFEKTYEERIDPDNLAIDGDNILVSSWGDRVFALNTMLDEEWTFGTDAENVRRGIVAQNQLIFPSRDRNIYALNKDTGALNWQSLLEGRSSQGFHIHNEMLYVIQKNGDKVILYKIDNEDGNIESRTELQIANSENSVLAAFFQDYMVLVNPINDVSTAVSLTYLPNAEQLWQIDSERVGTRNTEIEIQLN
ncbi:MAG: PQQ-binding-like beta-propeller repeat protein [Bacteroidota bacterium]